MNSHLRQIAFFVALLGIPLTAWYVVFRPQNADIAEAMQNITQRQRQLDTVAKLAERIPSLEQALQQGEQLVEQVEAQLPRRRDVEGVLENIWQIADRNGLLVRSVKTRPAVPSAVYMELPLEVSMDGPFEGFYRFLLELETLPRVTRLSEISIQEAGLKVRGPSNKLPPGSVATQFVLSIYFADSVPEVASAGAIR
ncbi:MAG: type 4a pilus biogenesis protein PilO [Planctomycetes bacterium]|jgi:type IV pilus assembly protein PilO|nr:type 4a pilus biogenesis protein PilO [Planctomycetota bacterium]MCP4838401.1 type 4a pilus biogenesis protein PilO [Planctomycetota bacterium]